MARCSAWPRSKSLPSCAHAEDAGSSAARNNCTSALKKSFQPARKAHPAFAVTDLDNLRKTLQARGLSTIEDDAIPGTQRFYVDDPWGNRLEFVEAGQ
jgi:hypothetical protein